jgi:glycosyltransferase involved in cell wall biosynthesis
MTDQRLNVMLGADSLLGRRSGVGRMTLQIAHSLRHHPSIDTLALLVGPRGETPAMLDRLLDEPAESIAPPAVTARAQEPPLARLRERIAALPALAGAHAAWVRRQMNRQAAALSGRTAKPVVYHETNMIARPFDGTSVVTINDLSWRLRDGMHPERRVAWIERRLPASLAQASRLIAISSFTACELTERLGVAADRIDVVPLAPSPIFRPLSPAEAGPLLRRLDLRPEGFVLSVSTLEPRKNFDRLLAAHLRLPAALRARHPLVIAGGRGWGETLTNPAADRAARAGELRLLGHVSDPDLAVLYRGCAVFAYPSLYEGFGLPIVEAMACGAPVVASGTTASGETAGTAALLVDPLDEHSIAEALRTVIEDATVAAELRAAGLARAAEFSWRRTVDGLIATWRKALSEKP